MEVNLVSQSNILKEEYIKLLNDKQVLLDWGKPQLEALYITRIGMYQVEKLQLQLHIKALKRKLEMCWSAINQGMEPDLVLIELQVASELAEAESKIMQQSAALQNAKMLLSNLGTPETSAELRKVYRQLAKQLHPDVNPGMDGELMEIWYLVKEAFEHGDLAKLKALQIVYEKELQQADEADSAMDEEELLTRIAVVKEGIKILQEDIKEIRSVFPFTIEKQIKDDEWVAAEQSKLQAEIEELKLYEIELEQNFKQLVNTL